MTARQAGVERRACTAAQHVCHLASAVGAGCGRGQYGRCEWLFPASGLSVDREA